MKSIENLWITFRQRIAPGLCPAFSSAINWFPIGVTWPSSIHMSESYIIKDMNH